MHGRNAPTFFGENTPLKSVYRSQGFSTQVLSHGAAVSEKKRTNECRAKRMRTKKRNMSQKQRKRVRKSLRRIDLDRKEFENGTGLFTETGVRLKCNKSISMSLRKPINLYGDTTSSQKSDARPNMLKIITSTTLLYLFISITNKTTGLRKSRMCAVCTVIIDYLLLYRP